MFDSLAEKLQATLSEVRGRGTLTEADINAAMREIRLALLEADVNFKVVKTFTTAVKDRALGADIVGKLNPGQQVVKIVSDELTELMGGASRELSFSPRPPTIVLMAGLQGSGRRPPRASSPATCAPSTTPRSRWRPATSIGPPPSSSWSRSASRPASTSMSRAPSATRSTSPSGLPTELAPRARTCSSSTPAGGCTSTRSSMDELANIKKAINPTDILLVVDAMTGQDAVNVAEQFAAVVDFDGVVMSKLDGDARGGAALSVKAVTGKPILFASTGEKLDQFERFHPDRMAQRILGMGDVMTLIEKAESSYDEQQAAELERKLRKQEFGLDDFLDQMRQIRKLGPLQSLLGMIPGVGKELRGVKVEEKEFDRLQAIILSMTPQERRHPELIKGSRRLRIAQGSGTNVQAVKQLIKQFEQMRKVMRQVSQGRMPDLGALMRQGR